MRHVLVRTWAIAIGLLANLIMGGMVCEESLPAYEDPRSILKGFVTGDYVLNSARNSVSFLVNVTNSYDETLEAEAVMGGQLVVTMGNNPGITKTFSVSQSDLITTGKYNSTSGVLRMDAGDTIRFRLIWDFIDDNGADLRATTFRYFEDPDCGGRCIAEEEVFVLKASMRIFPKISELETPLTGFSLCHVNSYVGPQFCLLINSSVPCSRRPNASWAPCPPTGN